MRVLITAFDLSRRGGVQLFVRDLAVGLLQQGIDPLAYSPSLGQVATEIRGWSIPVTSSLSTISEAPDVIIGCHHLEMMNSLLRFPECPGIFTLHSFDAPVVPRFPRIYRYVAVDGLTRNALVSNHGIDPSQVETVLNAVDLERFKPRPPLPAQPKRALLFGNQFARSPGIDVIREACRRSGIEIDLVGRGGRIESNPETLLPQYDLVFARARCAIEAMASGTAVILAGTTRMGGLVTTADIDRLRPLNFGRRTLQTAIDVNEVLAQIARYDPDDAAEVSRTIRQSSSVEAQSAEMLRVIEDTIEEHREQERDVSAEYEALSQYLVSLRGDYSMKFERLLMRISTWPLVGKPVAGVLLRVTRSLLR